MDPIEYLHLQMRLEGKALVGPDSLRQVEIVPGEELPLLLLARLCNGKSVTYYAESISSDLRKELSAAVIEFPRRSDLYEVLKSHHIPFEMGHYKTHLFPSKPARESDVLCLPKHDAQVKAFGFDGFANEVYAIARDGNLVAACVSTRENEACGEAWVYTMPEHRKQGFAQNVVRAWAGSLMEAGKVPFYSHEIENVASANLAKKLGLLLVFEEISVTRI